MEATTTENWSDANQRYLMAALGVVKQSLERHAAGQQGCAPRVTPRTAVMTLAD